MQPTFADCSTHPARLSNSGLKHRAGVFDRSHLALNAGGSVELKFRVDKQEKITQATLKVTALVAKLGPAPGFAPMDMLVNGEVLAGNLTVPGGGDLPHDNVLAVPGELLVPGPNTLEVRASPEARSKLWLYRWTDEKMPLRPRQPLL